MRSDIPSYLSSLRFKPQILELHGNIEKCAIWTYKFINMIYTHLIYIQLTSLNFNWIEWHRHLCLIMSINWILETFFLIAIVLPLHFILINMTYLSLMSRSPTFYYVFCRGLFPPWDTTSILTLLLTLSPKYHRCVFFPLGWPLKSLCFMWPYKLLSFLMHGILLLPILTTLQDVLIDD